MTDPDSPVAINTGYTNYGDRSTNERENSASANLPPRYQSSSQLADDLRLTASGVRRTRKRSRTPHRKIDADESSDASSIDEDYEVDSILSSIEEGLTCRGHMQRALHNHALHIAIIILVFLDALIVIFELLLELGAFSDGNTTCRGTTPVRQMIFCHYDTQGGVCAPTAIQIINKQNISASPGTGMENLCECGFRNGKRVCIRVGEAEGIDPGEILHIFSLVILSVFMIEIILKIVAFRLKYFTHKFEVFDGMVVVVSWVLDVASIIEEESFAAAASLIIVLRLWRVVRIVIGSIHYSKAQSDRQLEKARTEARKIIHAFHKCQDRVDVLEEEKVKLIKAVKTSGGVLPEQIKNLNE